MSKILEQTHQYSATRIHTDTPMFHPSCDREKSCLYRLLAATLVGVFELQLNVDAKVYVAVPTGTNRGFELRKSLAENGWKRNL